jgi:hypothetical protein
MSMRRLFCLLATSLYLAAPTTNAAAEIRFGVISHAGHTEGGETGLRTSIEQTDMERLDFVVVTGIKASSEPCDDELYSTRISTLHEAKNSIVVSLAGSDWAECPEEPKLAGIGRLNRLREMLFPADPSQERNRLPVIRQSAIVKFRAYAENARWEVGQFMFATINLPANNNHFLSAAGRNSEFEDRLVANRDWLHRIFLYAESRRLKGIVLFCDGNPLALAPANMRDGFAEVRRQLLNLTSRFQGKVLVVHGTAVPSDDHIRWRNNLGELGISPGWVKITANTSRPELFRIQPESSAKPR